MIKIIIPLYIEISMNTLEKCLQLDPENLILLYGMLSATVSTLCPVWQMSTSRDRKKPQNTEVFGASSGGASRRGLGHGSALKPHCGFIHPRTGPHRTVR